MRGTEVPIKDVSIFPYWPDHIDFLRYMPGERPQRHAVISNFHYLQGI